MVVEAIAVILAMLVAVVVVIVEKKGEIRLLPPRL